MRSVSKVLLGTARRVAGTGREGARALVAGWTTSAASSLRPLFAGGLSAVAGSPLRSFASAAAADAEVVVEVPKLGDSVSDGTITGWSKEVNDPVKEDEQIAEIETDKATYPIRSPVAGVLAEKYVKPGETVPVGAKLALVRKGAAAASTGAAAAPAKPAEAPKKEAAVAAKPAETPKRDASAAAKPAESPKAAPAAAAGPVMRPGELERRVPMTRMRKRIAERLKESQNAAALLTTFNEADMSAIMALRSEFKDAFEKKHGVKLGFMSAFVRAATVALLEQPVINAVIDGSDIVYRDYVDISVAVATPTGLVVPVLRNCQDMGFADIEKEIGRLTEKARMNQITVEDMQGGTFTISNGGVFGSLMGTPIVNPPQSAILGMHAIKDRPVAVNGKVEIRPMMYLAVTYDHRLIDGREAVTFLKKIKDLIEDPRRLIVDL